MNFVDEDSRAEKATLNEVWGQRKGCFILVPLVVPCDYEVPAIAVKAVMTKKKVGQKHVLNIFFPKVAQSRLH